MDSTNTQPPLFGPQFCDYPLLPQIVYITGPAANGVYPAFVQQYGGNLNFRSREACYVILEPNGIKLQPGYYDSRLIGNFAGLPLFAVTCCPGAAPSSSSSSSSASSTTPGSVATTQLGKIIGSTPSVTLPNIAVPANTLLTAIGTSTPGENITGMVYGGTPMLPGQIMSLPGGNGTARIFRLFVPKPVIGDIVLEGDGLFMSIQARFQSSLRVNAVDAQQPGSGTASAPNSGSVSTNFAPEFWYGAVLMVNPVGSFSWLNGMNDGQDVTFTDGLTTITVAEGWQIAASLGTAEAALSGITAAAWLALVETYA
jgi:hypothetical protein